MEDITIVNDKIQEGDLIIDTEKLGVVVNGEKLGVIVKCACLLDDDLIWESLDGKSRACDAIYIFKKVVIR
jgi:hypothetical protein